MIFGMYSGGSTSVTRVAALLSRFIGTLPPSIAIVSFRCKLYAMSKPDETKDEDMTPEERIAWLRERVSLYTIATAQE